VFREKPAPNFEAGFLFLTSLPERCCLQFPERKVKTRTLKIAGLRHPVKRLRRPAFRRVLHPPKGVAKVAAARKLAIRLYWMLRTNTGYPGVVRVESSSRVPLVSAS
jgi:hypothetical protein